MPLTLVILVTTPGEWSELYLVFVFVFILILIFAHHVVFFIVIVIVLITIDIALTDESTVESAGFSDFVLLSRWIIVYVVVCCLYKFHISIEYNKHIYIKKRNICPSYKALAKLNSLEVLLVGFFCIQKSKLYLAELVLRLPWASATAKGVDKVDSQWPLAEKGIVVEQGLVGTVVVEQGPGVVDAAAAE